MEISCEELLHYLSDYIDQELDEELSAAARRHLSSCDNCKVVLNTTLRTIELVGQEANLTIPADRRSDLFDRLEQDFLTRTKPD